MTKPHNTTTQQHNTTTHQHNKHAIQQITNNTNHLKELAKLNYLTPNLITNASNRIEYWTKQIKPEYLIITP